MRNPRTVFVSAALIALCAVQLHRAHGLTRLPSAADELSSRFVRFDRLRLADFGAPGTGPRRFLVSNNGAWSRLSIINNIPGADLRLRLTCDREIQPAPSLPSSAIARRTFNDPDGQRARLQESGVPSGRQQSFLLDSEVRRCELTYTDTENPDRTGQVEIVADTTAFPWLKDLASRVDSCDPSPAGAPQEHLDRFFESKHFPQLSCPVAADHFETLDTPESGFLAKTEMLLGQKLPADFIANGDPYAELDLSRAPRLKAVYLATLVYRADFYGTVMARLLRHHASRGALVHVVTTGYMMLEKDKRLLFPLAARFPNFRLQEFKYHDPGNIAGKASRLLTDQYRDMHIKLLITLSDENDRDNALVFGGRNIHDGFLFKTRPDHSKYPELVQYGIDDDFVHWNDFEMKITSRELATSTAAQLLRFLDRDTATETLAPFNVHGTPAPAGAVAPTSFRHFVSLPYSDNRSLEDLYVSLIDQASRSIRLSSPYLRPTARILEALERAAGRGVEVFIQTRVELEGDTQAWLYEEVNKESINRLYDKVKIFQWKENSILHSKFLLVDGRLALIGSVNLSRRSFIQDVENVFLIRSEPVVSRMEAIFGSYLEKSEPITRPAERKFFPSLLIRLLQNQF